MFPWFLRAWLAHTAQEKIRGEALRAVREQFAAAAAHKADAARGVPCDVGVVFALAMEAGGLEDRLEGLVTLQAAGFAWRKGFLGGRRLAIAHAGPGCSAAARAAQALIDGHQPGWVISTGFAGGLDPRIERGSILVADAVGDLAGAAAELELGTLRPWLAEQPRVRVGRLLTADRIISAAEEKHKLGRKHQALAVDMETAAVAEVCRERGRRFLAVRVISDPADESLPADLERLLAQRTAAGRWGAVLGTLLDRPGSAKELFRLKANAMAAADELGKFLVRLVNQLVPEISRNDQCPNPHD